LIGGYPTFKEAFENVVERKMTIELSMTIALLSAFGSDLSKFVEALRIARRCRRVILQNFAGTLIVDSIGVGMAVFGLLNPLLAAFIHVTSQLAFILNATRLLPRGSEG
jgi:cation transport ATPase